MDNSKKTDDYAAYMHELVSQQGVAVSTVSDGHVLMFKRSHFQAIIDQFPNNERLLIFIKRPEFKN